jgi:hypothetical protein
MSQQNVSPEEVQRIIAKYTNAWNSNKNSRPLWVVGANPGDSIQIPGITFGTKENTVAGMSIPVRAQLIVLNQQMVPESLLQTFLHEYGHSRYSLEHREPIDEIASEAAAIRFSLEALTTEGYPALAYREASAVQVMGTKEPYKSAVNRLAKEVVS